MNKRIEITVDSKGNSQVETKGFAGSECLEASRFVERALGSQASLRTTPEFFNSDAIQMNQAEQAKNSN